MPEKWTGRLVGRMHNHQITNAQLAKELGCSTAYVSMILNGSRTPKDGRKRLEEAVARLVDGASARGDGDA